MRRLNAEHQRRYMITVEEGGAAFDDFTVHFSRGEIPEQVSARLGEKYGLEDYSAAHAYVTGVSPRRARGG
jgi:hypothetical protein